MVEKISNEKRDQEEVSQNTFFDENGGQKLLNRANIKDYLITLGVLFGVIGLYYLISILLLPLLGPSILFHHASPIGNPLFSNPPLFDRILSA